MARYQDDPLRVGETVQYVLGRSRGKVPKEHRTTAYTIVRLYFQDGERMAWLLSESEAQRAIYPEGEAARVVRLRRVDDEDYVFNVADYY